MAKRSSTKIAEYVEARRELNILKRQLEADPTHVKSDLWAAEFRDAKLLVATLERTLTGGELGKATRLLTIEPTHSVVEVEERYFLIDEAQLTALARAATRLHTENRMNGDEMRDWGHTLESIVRTCREMQVKGPPSAA